MIYTPQRLPWKAVNVATRTLIVAWTFLGVMFSWETWGPWTDKRRIDTYVGAEHERRRLSANPASWDFEPLGVELPRGAGAAPGALSCLWGRGDEGAGTPPGHRLLLGGAGGLLRVAPALGGAP